SLKPIIYYSAQGFVAKINNDTVGVVSRYNLQNFVTSPISNSYEELSLQKYSSLFYVTREMIVEHLNVVKYPNPNYLPPIGIRNWPAHGDTNKGQAQNLAPFIDVNRNGVYEPMLGDYPRIYGDYCVLKLFSNPKEAPNGSDTDWFVYTYLFNCDTNEILSNSVFVTTHIVPRWSGVDEFYFNSYNDYDLGYYADDFVGVDVDLNMTYAYNGDDFDESWGVNYGYGSRIPAAGNIILKGIKQKNDQVDNPFGPFANQSVNGIGFGDGEIDNEYWGLTSSRSYNQFSSYPYTDSYLLQDFYNQTKGFNSDGTQNTVNGVPVVQSFFGNSDPFFYASQGVNHGNNHSEEINNNPPGDRRLLSSSGPGNYAVGDTIEIIQAWLVSLDTNAGNAYSSVTKLKSDAAKLRQYFLTNDLGCGKSFGSIEDDLSVQEKELFEFKMYPNPSRGVFTVFVPDANYSIEIYSVSGQKTDFTQIGHQIQINDPKGGIYIIQVQSEKGIASKKMVVMD
ncbi:MAG: T9SS type A sorting domain-containing protein, partial [Bacteroidetes bacterium]|nr:T9SS type A sorting domain-containing protein [Bacteroidota bacterium]